MKVEYAGADLRLQEHERHVDEAKHLRTVVLKLTLKTQRLEEENENLKRLLREMD